VAFTADDITRLQATIKSQNLNWVAGLTSLSALSEADLRLRLGADLTKVQARTAVTDASHATAQAAISYPSQFDWRNVNGANYITSIKDQGGCGSCVAFGTIATIEGTYQVAHNNPASGIQLSEAQLFYCYGKSEGATCESGWWPDQAFTACEQGLVDAACFPYTAGDQNCNLCAGSNDRLTKISAFHTMNNVGQMKQWISLHGPVSTCFSVYDDFFNYRSGVYHQTSTSLAGGHCVSVIGYSDPGGFWICKNSWGTGWGEAGFFCIAYGQCGIDSEMWACDGILETGWLMYPPSPTVVGLWAINQDNNAWVYLNGYGWRKISPNNTDIMMDMLSQLVAAKAAARPVHLYQQGGVITQIYVY
jgi:C1A family cysteine protease